MTSTINVGGSCVGGHVRHDHVPGLHDQCWGGPHRPKSLFRFVLPKDVVV